MCGYLKGTLHHLIIPVSQSLQGHQDESGGIGLKSITFDEVANYSTSKIVPVNEMA